MATYLIFQVPLTDEMADDINSGVPAEWKLAYFRSRNINEKNAQERMSALAKFDMYKLTCTVAGEDIDLEDTFNICNGYGPSRKQYTVSYPRKFYAMCVGDLVFDLAKGQFYACCDVGFEPVKLNLNLNVSV